MTDYLLLDVGNSRLKWAPASADGVSQVTALEHFGDPLSALDQIPDAVLSDARFLWLANVTGPRLASQLRTSAMERWGLQLQEARVQQGMAGLQVSYADPGRLGVDRWLMMLALWHERAGAYAVASAGTALTFDAVDASGRHLGGVIAPGLTSLQRAVLDTTRFKAQPPQPRYTEGLGNDTDACVRQGALHAAAGLLERLAGRYATGTLALQESRLVLSGGDAAELLRHISGPWGHRPDLVLDGLLALAKLSR